MRFVGLIFLLMSGFAFAQDQGILNKLLAPGPLMEGHKNLEATRCLDCHVGGQGVPSSKCMDCHKEIRAVVEAKRGFHGMQKAACISCHREHKGRDFDSMQVDEKTFDHKLTGFDLNGPHLDLKCSKCHTGKRSEKVIRKSGVQYFGQTASCVGCHKKHDVHFFKAPNNKKDCGECHKGLKWNDKVTFDHTVDAKFELEGAHAELKCAKCHVSDARAKISKYKWPGLATKACLSCHQDQHGVNMGRKFQGPKCETCHTQSTWKIEKFDHATITGFALKGKHAQLDCAKCHTQKNARWTVSNKKFRFTGLKTQCVSCHGDKQHLFAGHKSKRFPQPLNCAGCHSERDWKAPQNFDHGLNTRFAVDGEHTKLECSQCHIPQKHMKPPRAVKAGIYLWPALTEKTCENCHKSPHRGVFSAELLKKRCTECHTTQGWRLDSTGKSFDHSKARFQLTDRHSQLKCNECHVKDGKQIFKFPSVDKKFCNDCHSNPHRGQFHDKFAEQACTTCHTTKKFTERLAFDHNQTAHPLRGAHERLKCSECHTPTNERFSASSKSVKHKFLFPNLQGKSCVACHTDYHRGQLGSDCLSCHQESGWKPVKFDHGKQSQFPLKGEHLKVKCSECHRPIERTTVPYKNKNRPVVRFKPMPMNCVDCHKDNHNGKLGNRCQECHSERGWKLTADFHKNFTLSGVHYTLSCVECHKDNRKLAGMSENCMLCHQKDDIHNGTQPNCGECHKQQFWENADFKHSMSRFPLRGAHRTLDCVECHNRGIYQGTPSDCVSCHLQDALAVASPNHSGFTQLMDCTSCHRNQFSFRGAQ